MSLINILMKRVSVTKYSVKKPSYRKILRAIDYARFIPSAGNIYALRFLIVSGKEDIEKISNFSQQGFISSAHYVVVVLSEPDKLRRVYGERGHKYTSLQAGVAIGNFMLGLTENGLCTKWVRFFDDKSIKNLLDIPEDKSIEGIFPIGIMAKDAKNMELYPDLENIIYFDKWGRKEMTPKTRIEDF